MVELLFYVSPAGLVSSDLTWETVASTNFGIDATLLDSRLDLSFDVFKRETKDMLMEVSYPDILVLLLQNPMQLI